MPPTEALLQEMLDEFQLRKLVQAGPAQEVTHKCDAGIIRELVNAFPLSVRRRLGLGLTCDQLPHIFFVNGSVIIHIHGPEFQEHKRSAMLADPSLPEENWSLGGCFDRGSNRQERGQ